MIVAGKDTPLKPSYTLDIEAVSPDKPRHLQVLLYKQVVADMTANPGVQTVHLENVKLQAGENVLVLRPDPADGFYIPSKANPASKDNRALPLAFISFKLV